MIVSYLQRLLSPVKSKPNDEWLRLRDVIESGDHSGLEAWLKEVASLASDLESNFEVASRGGKTRYCLSKVHALEDRYRRQAAAYKKAIDRGLIHDNKLPRLYSSNITLLINRYAQ